LPEMLLETGNRLKANAVKPARSRAR